MYPTNPGGTHTSPKQTQTYTNTVCVLPMLYFRLFVHVWEVAIAIIACSSARLSITVAARSAAESFAVWSTAEAFAVTLA